MRFKMISVQRNVQLKTMESEARCDAISICGGPGTIESATSFSRFWSRALLILLLPFVAVERMPVR